MEYAETSPGELQKEKDLLQLEVQRLTRQMAGQKTATPQEIFRHLMRSLDRARKIIEQMQQKCTCVSYTLSEDPK